MEAWREELYHYGIKGMKWGIRRFQNKDGTLTARGKKRRIGTFRDYLNDDGSLNDKGKAKKKIYDEVNNFSEKFLLANGAYSVRILPNWSLYRRLFG